MDHNTYDTILSQLNENLVDLQEWIKKKVSGNGMTTVQTSNICADKGLQNVNLRIIKKATTQRTS